MIVKKKCTRGASPRDQTCPNGKTPRGDFCLCPKTRSKLIIITSIPGEEISTISRKLLETEISILCPDFSAKLHLDTAIRKNFTLIKVGIVFNMLNQREKKPGFSIDLSNDRDLSQTKPTVTFHPPLPPVEVQDRGSPDFSTNPLHHISLNCFLSLRIYNVIPSAWPLSNSLIRRNEREPCQEPTNDSKGYRMLLFSSLHLYPLR